MGGFINLMVQTRQLTCRLATRVHLRKQHECINTQRRRTLKALLMARSYTNVWTQWIVYKTACVQTNLPVYVIKHFYSKAGDDVIGIFHLHDPSGRTMALGSESLTEISTRDISWRVWQTYRLYVRVSWNMGASTSWNHQGLYRDWFAFCLKGIIEGITPKYR
jgi:hypothetical protein